jgi:hypothetical protein
MPRVGPLMTLALAAGLTAPAATAQSIQYRS